MIKPRNDEYYDMYEDDTPSPEEVARHAAGRALDTAHTKLVAVLDDLNTIQQIHYAVCYRETITTKDDATNTLLSLRNAFVSAFANYLSAAHHYTGKSYSEFCGDDND